MNIIRFPKIFNNNSTAVLTDSNEAMLQSIRLLIYSEVSTLLGDPGFGVNLKKYFYEQNNYILKDILIDEIYTKICTFLPQIFLERKNIQITQKHDKLYMQIAFKLRDTFESNIYELVLFNLEDSVE